MAQELQKGKEKVMKIKVEFWGYDNSTLNLPDTAKYYTKLAENGIILRRKDGVMIVPSDYEDLTEEEYARFGDENQIDPQSGVIVDITWIEKPDDENYDVYIIYVVYDVHYRQRQKQRDKRDVKIFLMEQKLEKLKNKK